MIIERTVARRDGTPRHIPIVEITPGGDIREIDARPLRVSLLTHTALAHLDYLDGRMNARAAEGHRQLNELGRISADYLAAERESRQSRSRKVASR